MRKEWIFALGFGALCSLSACGGCKDKKESEAPVAAAEKKPKPKPKKPPKKPGKEGVFATVTGSVSMTDEVGQEIPAKQGLGIFGGEIVRSDAAGGATLKLFDNTELTLGADTEIVVLATGDKGGEDRPAVVLRFGQLEAKVPARSTDGPGFAVYAPRAQLVVHGNGAAKMRVAAATTGEARFVFSEGIAEWIGVPDKGAEAIVPKKLEPGAVVLVAVDGTPSEPGAEPQASDADWLIAMDAQLDAGPAKFAALQARALDQAMSRLDASVRKLGDLHRRLGDTSAALRSARLHRKAKELDRLEPVHAKMEADYRQRRLLVRAERERVSTAMEAVRRITDRTSEQVAAGVEIYKNEEAAVREALAAVTRQKPKSAGLRRQAEQMLKLPRGEQRATIRKVKFPPLKRQVLKGTVSTKGGEKNAAAKPLQKPKLQQLKSPKLDNSLKRKLRQRGALGGGADSRQR